MTFLWWHWLVLGLLLVVSELATPGGFYIIFFGIGALIVGSLAGAEFAGPLWLQVMLFPIFSILGLTLFRTKLLELTQVDPQAPAVDSLVGEIGTVSETVMPGAVGKIELRGASWSARNTSEATLIAGMRCQVLRVEGLMVFVAPEGGRS